MPPKRRIVERKAKDSSSEHEETTEPESPAAHVKIEVKEEPIVATEETTPERVGIDDSDESGGGGGIISSEEEDDKANVLKENTLFYV